MGKLTYSKHALLQMTERGATEEEVREAIEKGETMKLTYDPAVDALYVRFQDKPVQVTTQRLTEDIAVNYDPKGEIVGIEILDARHYLKFVGAKPKIEAENLAVS